MAELNNTNWDQHIGEYDPDRPCCIGAHLAHWFHRDLGGPGDYFRGETEVADFLGCNSMQLNLLLHAAGAPEFPFGPEPWSLHPTEVWRNLLLIETLPPENADPFWYEAEGKEATEAWLQQQRKRIHDQPCLRV